MTGGQPLPISRAAVVGSNSEWPDLDLDDFLDAEYNVHQTTASDLAAAATAADGVLQFELDEEEGESEQLLQHRPAGAAAATHPISLFTASAAQHSSVEVNDSSCSSSESVGAVLLCLYASHALSRWAWRTWEFAVALILMRLHPSSLLLVSVYGLLDNLVRLVLGGYVGSFIDRSERLKGAVACYAAQNVCIALSAAAAGVLVWFKQHRPADLSAQVYWPLLCTTVIAGACSSIGSLGASVSVERECPKVLCGSNTAALSKINSVMRAIDLSCQMLAPVAAGFLMTYASMLAAIAVLAVYSMAVWLPECLLLRAAHSRSHLLRQPKQHHHQYHGTAAAKPHPLTILLGCHGWSIYWHQSSLLAGLALALLFLTVLSLGFLMTSYLAWRGMSEATLSLFRAGGALSGLTATLLFHPLHRWLGLSLSGLAGIAWQLVCLLAGVIPVVLSHWGQQEALGAATATAAGTRAGAALLPELLNGTAAAASNGSTLGAVDAAVAAGGNASSIPGGTSAAAAAAAAADASVLLYVLLAGLVSSRLGLWLFDLAVTQLQQEMVPGNQLGTVGGVQASIQSFFEICSFVAGIAVHQPQRFHWLMLASCAAVATAAGLYLAFVCRASGSSRSGGGLHGASNGFKFIVTHVSQPAASERHGYDSIDAARRESAGQ